MSIKTQSMESVRELAQPYTHRLYCCEELMALETHNRSITTLLLRARRASEGLRSVGYVNLHL